MVIKRSLKGKKILVTCGPTWVPIDPVRVISNHSTGELGHRITEELKKAGADVTLLEGQVTDPFKIKNIKIIKFTFFKDLKNLLKKELRNGVDGIIHAAAVSDYQLLKTFNHKLSSTKNEFTLKLVPTEKLIHLIKRIDSKILLVGFKLNMGNQDELRREARKLFEEADCDLIVANKSHKNKYGGFILDKNMQVVGQANNRTQMAKTLVNILKDHL